MAAPFTPAEIISLTNVVRQSQGLMPLHPDSLLTQAAHAKAFAMLAANSWSHNTPTATAWEFLDQAGYRYQIAGENLARNYSTATQVMSAWENSPSHLANLLNPDYTQIGVAVATGSADATSNTLVVQYMAAPLSQTTTLPQQFHPTTILSFNPAPISGWLYIFIPLLILLSALKINHKKQKPKNSKPQIKHWHN
jgi:hypothetical protein